MAVSSRLALFIYRQVKINWKEQKGEKQPVTWPIGFADNSLMAAECLGACN